MSTSARRKIVEQYQTIEQLTARIAELENDRDMWKRAFENGGTETMQKQLATAEQRVAEACALACEDVIGNTANDQRMIAAIDCSAMIRSGEWRKFVKEG